MTMGYGILPKMGQKVVFDIPTEELLVMVTCSFQKTTNWVTRTKFKHLPFFCFCVGDDVYRILFEEVSVM